MPSATSISIISNSPLHEKDCQTPDVAHLPKLTPRRRQRTLENPLPVPETPFLPSPPDTSKASFTKPSRQILSTHDHDLFLRFSTKDLVLAFVFSLSESVADTEISAVKREDQLPVIRDILEVLSSISDLVNSYPPKDQGTSRFGNPAFQDFIDGLESYLPSYHKTLNVNDPAAIREVSTYLLESFGSRARIDYGSGHELNFLIWLLCLNRLSLLDPQTFPAVTLLVFPAYIHLLRKIQSTYYLEPAGSHGVWGLDDYQFLPFLFGASQLLHHPYIRPKSIHNEFTLEEGADEYIYLDMVRWTVATKTVKGLKWTQPMLDDISGAKNWEKVEQGMRRMFVKEVLGKLPIMQHFMFGSLIPAAEGMGVDDVAPETDARGEDMHKEGPGHVHRDDVWGDCCGIKIPSTVVAAQEDRKGSGDRGLRRIPFD
ncbi:Serine/threonine-protein phosphatase 2A activator 2 [Agyrium rufum]|nr:Serine/threonine-protein phosphatase 2A activator 2 [Agyrium rufum]